MRPSKPNRLKIVALISALSFTLLCTIVVFREYLRNDLEQAADVERKLGFSPIASIPRIKRKWFSAAPSAAQFESNQDPSFSEAIRSLRTRLLLSITNQNRSCFAITSPNPNEARVPLLPTLQSH